MTRITARPTFDEARERPRLCPCGRHWVTGEWSRLYCPFDAVPHRGLWPQPDEQPLCE